MRLGKRRAGALAIAVVAAAVVVQAASASGRHYFHRNGFYNCTAVLSTGSQYVDSYQFRSRHRYAVGHQRHGRLTSHIRSGRYKLRGKRIVGVTGPLARHHESLLIQRSDLALEIAGHVSAIRCRRPGSKTKPPSTTPTPTPTPGATPTPTPGPTLPTGYYSCKHTTEVVSGPGAGYYSTYAQDIQFHADGTYHPINDGTYVGDNHWTQHADTVTFTSGPYSHDKATWYPGGVAMPHAGSNVPSSYTLVIYDTVREGGIPPSAEFSTTDGPGGSSSAPMSFTYCNLETPGS
jgi:hypothetical protein